VRYTIVGALAGTRTLRRVEPNERAPSRCGHRTISALRPHGLTEPRLLPAASYAYKMQRCLAAVSVLDGTARDALASSRSPSFREKVEGEFESLLLLYPDIILVLVSRPLSMRDLIRLRAYPVHAIGLVDKAVWADGSFLSPSEFFFHDLDHARYKIREDLRLEGIELPDPYQDGTTLDPLTGHHRAITPLLRPRIGDVLWARGSERSCLADHLVDTLRHFPDPRSSLAAELLLFEVLHEKGMPLDERTVRRELIGDTHLSKVRTKIESGFYRPLVATTVADLLPSAQRSLIGAL
jgi:hypothetical protein